MTLGAFLKFYRRWMNLWSLNVGKICKELARSQGKNTYVFPCTECFFFFFNSLKEFSLLFNSLRCLITSQLSYTQYVSTVAHESIRILLETFYARIIRNTVNKSHWHCNETALSRSYEYIEAAKYLLESYTLQRCMHTVNYSLYIIIMKHIFSTDRTFKTTYYSRCVLILR